MRTITMKPNPTTIHENMRTGVAFGIKAWTIYAIVECWLLVILPWILNPNSYLTRFHWVFTVTLVFVYLIIGSVIGVGIGVALTYARRIALFKGLNSSIFYQI